MLNNIIGVNEASEITGLSPGTVKNYCAEGKIVAKKIGQTWVIDKNILKERIKMKAIYEKAVKMVGYDGTTEECIEYYDSMQDYRNDTQYDTDDEFNESVRSAFNVDPSDVKGSIIVLDSVGSVDGVLFTSEDDEEYILDTIKEYFK